MFFIFLLTDIEKWYWKRLANLAFYLKIKSIDIAVIFLCIVFYFHYVLYFHILKSVNVIFVAKTMYSFYITHN